MVRSRSVLIGLLLVQAGATHGASFTGVGDLPGGASFSYAYGVSPDGSTVVGQSESAAGVRAYRWTTAGGMVDLGTVAGGVVAEAKDASNAGGVVVGNVVGAPTQGFRWDAANGMVGLGYIAGGSFGISGASAVTPDGSVIAGETDSPSGVQAYRWTQAGGFETLGDLPGGAFESAATDISFDGSVVVGSGLSASGGRAFLWTDSGGMVDLGTIPGTTGRTAATGVSGDGSTVVGYGFGGGSDLPFRWTASGGMVSLGRPFGGTTTRALDVSGNGSVVVGCARSCDIAFIWTAASGMRNLQQVLQNDYGLAVGGWILQSAEAISADGTTIVGRGINPQGETEGWIAIIPEPATIVLLAAGLAALGGMRADRRRRAG